MNILTYEHENVNSSDVSSVLSNSGFLSTEFKSNSGESLIAQGLNPVNRVSRKWGIDTVRFKFYLTSQEELENYRACFYKEMITFNIVKMKFETVYLYYNHFGQKFLYNPDGSCYLEFSLPKFLKYENTAYCDEMDLLYYCNKYLAPYCHNSYILLNRIDFALQFSFNNKEELTGFDNFLRGCSIRHKQSSKDYAFWKFEERVIRFYSKKEDIERPGNKAHPSQGETYNQWLNSLRWTEDNYIGRLEYELKRGYIEKYFKGDNKQVHKIDYDLLRRVVDDMFLKDFPFKEFSFSSAKPFNDCLEQITNNFQRPEPYLKFICLAQKYSIQEARQLISRQLYSKMKHNLKERLGLTFEQILKAGDCVLTFPDKIIWEDKPISEYQELEFAELLSKNIIALQGDTPDSCCDFDFNLQEDNSCLTGGG